MFKDEILDILVCIKCKGKLIRNEDTLKAIYLHEYGHIINNHFQSKRIKIQQSKIKEVLFSSIVRFMT